MSKMVNMLPAAWDIGNSLEFITISQDKSWVINYENRWVKITVHGIDDDGEVCLKLEPQETPPLKGDDDDRKRSKNPKTSAGCRKDHPHRDETRQPVYVLEQAMSDGKDTSRIRDLDGLVEGVTERLRVTIEHHERLRDEAQKDVDRHDSMIRRCRAALEGLAAADGDVPEYYRQPTGQAISGSAETGADDPLLNESPGGTA